MASPGDFQTLTSGAPAADPEAARPTDEPALRLSVAVPSQPGELPRGGAGSLDWARSRASFPTLDVAGALAAGESAHAENEPKGILAAFSADRLGVTDEHPDRYCLQSANELGRGGIGRVYVALDRHLGREVAVKELLLEEQGRDGAPSAVPTIMRFLREARITGQLDHPNIVPVYEIGRRADGSLYYTMRVVRGRTLARALTEAATLSQRLELLDHFVGLCQAIAYAHSRGIVHRDIKPDNVMVGEFGETVVLDWGMAKDRAWETREESGGKLPNPAQLELTVDGSLCGTPNHMSPEQARGAIQEVDERSDVWALGVVLYTILAGRTPFSGKTLLDLISQIRAGRPPLLAQVDPSIPPELSAIAMRALNVDRAKRYASAKELLYDLAAYRSGARVTAYQYSSLELLRRFLERHRTAAVASAVGVTVALVLAVASYVRVAAARDRALLAEQRATLKEREARTNLRASTQSLSEVLIEKAEQAMSEGDRTTAELFAAHALELSERADARGVVLASESEFRPEPGARLAKVQGCRRAAVSFPAGLFGCIRDKQLLLQGLRNGQLSTIDVESPLVAIDFSADGSRVAVATEDGRVLIYPSRGAAPPTELKGARLSVVALASGGKYVAAGGPGGNVTVWDSATPTHSWSCSGSQGVSALEFLPDSSELIIGGELGQLSACDFLNQRRREFPGHSGTVRALAFAQQGRYLASAGSDRTVRLWQVHDATPLMPPIVHSDAITTVSWSADGRLLSFGGKDKNVHVVDLRNGSRRAQARLHQDPLELVAISADASELVSSSHDLGAKLWSLSSLKTPFALAERGNVLTLAFVPGTREIVSGGLGADGVCIWSLENGSCQTRLPAGVDRVRALAVSRDGTRLAFAGSAPRVFLWDLPSRIPLRVFDTARDEVRAVAFSDDSKWLAFAGLDRRIEVVDANSFAPILKRTAETPLQAVAFCGLRRQLLAGERSGAISGWNLPSGDAAFHFKAHDDWVLAISPSPDGRRLASVSADGLLKLWELDQQRLVFTFRGHEGRVLAVAFSGDGRLLATGAEDKTVRLWSVDDGRELAVLAGHAGAVRSLAFIGSPALLASASDDGTIRLWHLDSLSTPGVTLAQRIETRFGLKLAGTRVSASKF